MKNYNIKKMQDLLIKSNLMPHAIEEIIKELLLFANQTIFSNSHTAYICLLLLLSGISKADIDESLIDNILTIYAIGILSERETIDFFSTQGLALQDWHMYSISVSSDQSVTWFPYHPKDIT